MSDLELELRVGAPQDRELRVEVLQSPAGEASVTTTFPYDQPALESRLKDLQLALLSRSSIRRRVVPEHERAVQVFGQELFDTIFTGEARSLFDRSREHAAAAGVGLRVQLRFESADMSALPWEFLHDSRRNEYLSLSRATPVVRYVEVPQPQRPLVVARPLRVLAMVASPSDLPALDVDQERARIDAALGGLAGHIDLHWLEGQTWRDLQSALQGGTWHAFHFVGHGGFDTARGEGIIALCNDDGATRPLGASELGMLLGDHESLRLAVLNSCDGARADRLDIFSSTAAVLVRRGTPAVIAMQYEITDVAAVELSRSFYAALAQGLPVDAALTEARKAVALGFPGTVEWGTPVLHLRAPDGRIFDLEPGPVPPPLAFVAPPTSPAPRLARRRAIVAAAAAGVVAIVAGVIAVVGGGSDEIEASGLGRTVLEVGDRNAAGSHLIELPPDTVALVTARPLDGNVDPDLGAVTSHRTTRELERYLAPAGFDADHFAGAFADYDGVPAGRVVARTDEGAAGATERLAVLAPFGGSFSLVVGAADGVPGKVELSVRIVEIDTPGDGQQLVDRVLDHTLLQSFLSELARQDLSTGGAINVVPHLEGGLPTGDIETLFGEDLFGEVDPGMFDCLLVQLDDVFGEPGAATLGPSETDLQGALGECGGSGVAPRPFTEAVAARLDAEGVKPPDLPLSCPPDAELREWTHWLCRVGDAEVVWVVVLAEGRWAYDYGPDLVRSIEAIAPPNGFCREIRAAGWSYFYAVVYWLAEGRPARLDADGDGIPCETQYPEDEVARLWA